MIEGISFTQVMGHLKVCKGPMVLMKGKLHPILYCLQARVDDTKAIVPCEKSDQNQSQL